ncbi:MAG: GAF domain-containing protein [Chloroflexi bacterium]|nr:GAF domain-containing protein [Chloroflexota bacterium]MDA1227725.1 GAF domain-containing protein [Chloroflexota bacterium]
MSRSTLQGKCIWVNRSGENLLQQDAKDIIGRFIFELFPGQSRFQIRAWRRVIDAIESSSFISDISVDGEIRKFQTSIFPVMDDDGNVKSVVSIGRPFEDREVLQHENQMRGAELDLIQEISSIITSSLEIGDLYERFATEFKRLVDFDRIVFMEMNDDGESLTPAFVSSIGPHKMAAADFLAVQKSGMDRVMRNQTTLVENDLKVHRKFAVDEELLAEGIRAIIRIPLVTRNGAIGVMALDSYHPNAFGPREQAVAERLAAQIAPAIENARLYHEAQEYTKELEVIDEIAGLVTSSLRIEEVYERLSSEIGRLVDFDRMSVILVDSESGIASQEYATMPNEFGLERRAPWSISNTATEKMIEECATLIEADLSKELRFEPDRVLLDAGIRSVIRVPLASNERAIGVLALHCRRANAFGPRERRVMERLVAQIAPGIENARLYQEARERAKELQVIDDIATIMISSLHTEEVYERFASEVKKLVAFDRMTVILIDAEADEAVVTYASGFSHDILHNIVRRPLKTSHVQWIIDHRDSLVVDDLELAVEPTFSEDPLMREAGFRSGIRVPLLNKNQVIGTFTLWSKSPQMFGSREKRIVSRLAAQIEPAIENANLYEEVEQTLNSLRTTQEQMMQMERLRAMGELSRGVAHDLNNTLSAILGRTQILMNQITDETHLKSLRIVEQAAQDSAQVVKRILKFTKLDDNSEFVDVDVNQLVTDVIELTRHKWTNEAQSKGQAVEMSTKLQEVPHTSGNYSELREVLTNLVINAYEAIEGDGTIELQTSSSADFVRISLRDTGKGMTPEVRKKVFDPYFTTRGSEGNGIGTTVSQAIITQHGGTIDVESELGVGTTFNISLPITSEIDALFHDAPEAPQEKDSKVASILVVEDEEAIRETLSEMLQLGGHTITLAENGEEGLKCFKEAHFDIVFTDLGMPGISGWEVARAVRGMREDVPIVMVTGWGVGISQEEMDENGVDEVLPKPFDIDFVLDLVQRIVEG